MADISLFAAFGAGLISFVSPCVLPLVPAYIAFMSGISLVELTDDSSKGNRTKVIISSLVFILGFSLVFVILGATATAVGKFLLQQMGVIRIIAGLVVIVFGLHLTGLIQLKFLLYEKRMHSQKKDLGYGGIFLIGMAFAFGWSPCLGPILSGILGIAATKENISEGITLLSVYSLGLGLPFFLTAIATSRAVTLFTKIKKHMRKIEITSGAFLVVIGLMMVFDVFTIINSYLNIWFPFLQTIG